MLILSRCGFGRIKKMTNRIRLKKSLQSFNSYSADKTSFNYRLNANESPFKYQDIFNASALEKKFLKSMKIEDINRYPDSTQEELKDSILKFYGLKKGQVLLGNGSDELILYILLTLTGKSSNVLYLDPSFSMYEILTKGLGLKGISVPLTSGFKLDVEKVLKKIKSHDPDIVFIASPNNPTGNAFKKEDIIKIVSFSKGIVVLDEAYSDYSDFSFIKSLKKYKNMLIMKTMSKVGFASLRLGFLLGEKRLIDSINKLRLPYNISSFSQSVANKFFKNPFIIGKHIDIIKAERSKVEAFLKEISNVKVYSSDSNFILIRLKRSNALFNFLRSNDLIVKNFPNNKKLHDCLRITIGLPKENKRLMLLVSQFLNK
jgi:histidinol-phosphate aminotransferase